MSFVGNDGISRSKNGDGKFSCAIVSEGMSAEAAEMAPHTTAAAVTRRTSKESGDVICLPLVFSPDGLAGRRVHPSCALRRATTITPVIGHIDVSGVVTKSLTSPIPKKRRFQLCQWRRPNPGMLEMRFGLAPPVSVFNTEIGSLLTSSGPWNDVEGARRIGPVPVGSFG